MNRMSDEILTMHGFKGIGNSDILKMHGFNKDTLKFFKVQSFAPHNIYNLKDGNSILVDEYNRKIYTTYHNKVTLYPTLVDGEYTHITYHEEQDGLYAVIGKGSMIFQFVGAQKYYNDTAKVGSSTLTFSKYKVNIGKNDMTYTRVSTKLITNVATGVSIPYSWYGRGDICPPASPYSFGYDPVNNMILGSCGGFQSSQDGDKINHYVQFSCSLNTGLMTSLSKPTESANSSGPYFGTNVRYFPEGNFGVFYRIGRRGGGDEYGAYGVRVQFIWYPTQSGAYTTKSLSIDGMYDSPPEGVSKQGCYCNIKDRCFFNTRERMIRTYYDVAFSGSGRICNTPIYEIKYNGFGGSSGIPNSFYEGIGDIQQKSYKQIQYTQNPFIALPKSLDLDVDDKTILVHSDGTQNDYEHLIKQPAWTGITENVVFMDENNNILPHHLENKFSDGYYFRVKMNMRSGWNVLKWDIGDSNTSNPNAVYRYWKDLTVEKPSEWEYPSDDNYVITTQGLSGFTTTAKKEFIDTKIKITDDCAIEMYMYPNQNTYWQIGMGKEVCGHGYRYDDGSSYYPQGTEFFNNKDGVKASHSYYSDRHYYAKSVCRTNDNQVIGGHPRYLVNQDYIVGFESYSNYTNSLMQHVHPNYSYWFNSYNNNSTQFCGEHAGSLYRTRDTRETLTLYNEQYTANYRWLRIRSPGMNCSNSFRGKRSWIISDGSNTYVNYQC